MKPNEIAIARRAIRSALKSGAICRERIAAWRVGYEAIRALCVNEAVASDLTDCAVADVFCGY
jgi:hypothetical protein